MIQRNRFILDWKKMDVKQQWNKRILNVVHMFKRCLNFNERPQLWFEEKIFKIQIIIYLKMKSLELLNYNIFSSYELNTLII